MPLCSFDKREEEDPLDPLLKQIPCKINKPLSHVLNYKGFNEKKMEIISIIFKKNVTYIAISLWSKLKSL